MTSSGSTATTRTPTRTVVDAVVMAALTLLALTPFFAAFESANFWIAAAGGVLLGTVIAVVGSVLRWGALSVAAIATVSYFVFGGVLVFRDDAIFGVIPGLDVLTALAVGVVQVWKQTLTLPAPFTGFDQLNLAPYIAGLVVSVTATSLALRVRRSVFALMPTALLLVFSIAFSTYDGFFPAIVGAVFGALALGWAAWRSHRRRLDAVDPLDVVGDESPARPQARMLAATAIGVLIVAAIASGTAVTAAGAQSRDVIRDHVVPPLELYDYSSPLTSFRKYVTDGEDADLFTVEGLPAGSRIRLATLDLYDGIVYKVSGSGGAGAGVFSRVGREIDNDTTGEPANVTIEIRDLTGVWVPTVGYLDSMSIATPGGEPVGDALHYNAATGTAVLTTGVRSGDSYELATVIPAVPDDEALTNAEFASVTTPTPARVPSELTGLVDTVIADAVTPYEQVRAIESYFASEGWFSNGLEGQVASRSGHSDGREAALVSGDQMIGDDEQYAVAMALMASQVGIPVRVVMGFTPESDGSAVAVTGDDLHAWVEVPFDGLGWVAFSPTPSEDRVPLEQAPQPHQKPRVQVAQPPDTPQEPAELPPAPPVEEALDSDPPADLGWLWLTLQIVGLSLAVLILLLGPSVVLAARRARRRRRRAAAPNTADRVDGGWAELVDSATDVGLRIDRGSTRREQAHALDAQYPEFAVGTLAVRADAAVFGAGDPTVDEVNRYWADVDTATARIALAMPWYRRWGARLFPLSTLRRQRMTRVSRSQKEQS